MFFKVIRVIKNKLIAKFRVFWININKILNQSKTTIFGNKNYVKFVVVTRSRTGSNLLISLLNSHKHINAQGEAFRRLNNKTSLEIYNSIFPLKSLYKCLGFKLFYYHPLDSDDNLIWRLLEKDKNIKIIHLKRNNLLRVHVSRLIAEKTDEWARIDNSNLNINKKVEVSLTNLMKDFNETKNHIINTEKLFREHNVLEVVYEDLINNQQETIDSILSFLNVKKVILKSSLVRQNPEELKNLISNYDEVKNALIKSDYQYMID
jgi:LPS sulfotransferase NodH